MPLEASKRREAGALRPFGRGVTLHVRDAEQLRYYEPGHEHAEPRARDDDQTAANDFHQTTPSCLSVAGGRSNSDHRPAPSLDLAGDRLSTSMYGKIVTKCDEAELG